MYTWIWIEGEKALNEFCEKRFKERPRFIENCGHVGKARVRQIYKYIYDENGDVVGVAHMFLLYMEAPSGMERGNVIGEGMFSDIQRMTYEEIRADKTSILKRRG